MNTGSSDPWTESSRAERIAHCIARSALAESRAARATGNLKEAYLEIAANWLLLAEIIQEKDD